MVYSRLYILLLCSTFHGLVSSTFLSKVKRVFHTSPYTTPNHVKLLGSEYECISSTRGGSSNHPQYDDSDDEEMPTSQEFHDEKMGGQYSNVGPMGERNPYLNEQQRPPPYNAEQNYQGREVGSSNVYDQVPHNLQQGMQSSDQRYPQQYPPYDGRGEPNLPPPEGSSIAPPPFPENAFNEPPLPGRGSNYPQHMGRPYSNANRPPPIQRNQRLQQPTETVSNPSPELELESFDKDLIFNGLKRMYRKKILPLEVSSKYGHFHSPPLSPSDFDAKPMVLLLGQYSVGKTSFIRYLLGRDFPGIRVGPEPTTDRFTCILHGDTDKVIPGAALCSQSDRPFRGLSPFGNNFLSKLEAVELDAPILRNITLVDTPGILSGTKQSVGRNYDYDAVMKWFAERADLIIVMFDAHKLDISDELKRVIEMMGPHADKLRVVLNKADSISTQQLMRVYGALMWQLGKVMNTPEVCRVYIGSFWGSPLKNVEQAALFNKEKLDLFMDIAQLPQNAVMRRINELVKRARGVKVHAYIIHYLRKQLPYTFGKKEKQQRLIDRLDKEMIMCARRYELPRGDFPPVEPMRQALREIKDLSEFPKLDKRMVKEMDKVFSVDIPEMLERARGDR